MCVSILSRRRFWIQGVLISPINDAGYRVGNAIAADNLRIGRTVIADSVNPIPLSRDAWVEVANRAQVSVVEIEFTCSDTKETSASRGNTHIRHFQIAVPYLARGSLTRLPPVELVAATASASPRASMQVVEAVGASPSVQAS